MDRQRQLVYPVILKPGGIAMRIVIVSQRNSPPEDLKEIQDGC
jgi:hypothetical protein